MPRCDERKASPGAGNPLDVLVPPTGEPPEPAPGPPIRVVIADGQALMRSGLAHLLEQDGRLRVVAVSEGGMGVLDICASAHVDVLVADAELHDVDVLELIHLVSEQSPATHILVLGATASWRVGPLIAAGAGGFLLKDTAPEGLRSAIVSVHAGDQVLSRKATLALMTGASLHRLTPRETTVLRHIARGSTNKEIALAMDIHEKTVRNYVSRLHRKLRSPSRTELTRLAHTVTRAQAPLDAPDGHVEVAVHSEGAS